MTHRGWTAWTVCGLLVLLAGSAVAQGFGDPCRHCCPTCALPPVHCSCTSLNPVVETSYRQQQVTTYRNVAETQYQRQQIVQRVPVAKTTNVTVDEGHYQMVWVPKPVTKQIAYTECEDRVTTQLVPQTVVRSVPQVTTQLVPQQTVRYVPQTTHMAVHRPACSTCGPFTPAASVTPWTPRAAAPAVAAPVATAPAVPHVSAAPRPAPDPNFSAGHSPPAARTGKDGWSTIPSRSDDGGDDDRDRLGGWETAPERATTPPPWPRTSGRFTPAPSAASVWQSTGRGVRR